MADQEAEETAAASTDKLGGFYPIVDFLLLNCYNLSLFMHRPDSLELFWRGQSKYWIPDANSVFKLIGDGAQHIVVEGPNGTGKSTLLRKALERAAELTGHDFVYANNWSVIPGRLTSSYSPTLLVVDEFARPPLDYSDQQAFQEGYAAGHVVDEYLENFIGNPNVNGVIITAASTQSQRKELGDIFVQVNQQLGGEGKVVTHTLQRQYIQDDEVERYFGLLGAPKEIVDFVMESSHRAFRTPRSLGRFERTNEGLFMLKFKQFGFDSDFAQTHPRGIASLEDLRDAFVQGEEFSTWREIRIGGSFRDLWKAMVDLQVVQDHPLVALVRSKDDALSIWHGVQAPAHKLSTFEWEIRTRDPNLSDPDFWSLRDAYFD